jgi:peroxin-6
MIRRGDVVAVPVYQDKPLSPEEDAGSSSVSSSDSDDSDQDTSILPFRDALRRKDRARNAASTGIVYFLVTSLSFDPLVPLEEDFRSSISSQARAGELGCWVDIGKGRGTRMILTGLERQRVGERGGDRAVLRLRALPFYSSFVRARTPHVRMSGRFELI